MLARKRNGRSRGLALLALMGWAAGVQAAGVTGFGGPLLRLGAVSGDSVVSVGGRGGALFDNGFYLGGEGAGSVNTFAGGHRLGYGGLVAGMWMPAGAVTDWGVELMVGAGGVKRRGAGESDGVFVMRPALRLGVRAAPWLVATLDVAWRQVMLSDTPGLGDGDLSGWEVGLGLAFGGRRHLR